MKSRKNCINFQKNLSKRISPKMRKKIVFDQKSLGGGGWSVWKMLEPGAVNNLAELSL